MLKYFRVCETRSRFLPGALACVALVVGSTAQSQTVVSQGFQTTNPAGWSFSTPNGSYTPQSGVMTDGTGANWLELTNNTQNEATAAVYTGNFNSAGASVYATFNYQMYGGANGTTIGGDGITFFLYDASKTFSAGAYGGSLGYAQKTGINGLSGGYIGVGLDAYGNFSSATEGRVGGYNNTTGQVTESIAVRGPGSGTNGYAYLGGTSAHLGTGDAATNIDSTVRPTTTNNVQILLSATNQLTVTLAQGSATPQTVLQLDLSGYARPDLLSFGFTAGTGGATDFMLVNNLTVTTVTASKWLGGNTDWGLNTNWNPSVVPTNGSDLLFDNSYVNSAQTIQTNGNRTIRSLTFDAGFNYTVDSNNTNTLTVDSGGIAGFSGIQVTQTHGIGVDTINSKLALNNDIRVTNNANGTLNLNGGVVTNGHKTTFDGSGAGTFVAGVISGTGSIAKNDAGTATLSAANTYTGGTTINYGTLNANNNSALGTGAVTLAGGTLGSTNGASVSNNVTLSGDAGLSGITMNGTLTQAGANHTVTLLNASQNGNVKLSDTNTGRTMTVLVDSGTSSINGVISNGGTGAGSLTKTGVGELVLGGVNTYTGTTTVNAGTLTLGGNDRLANTTSLSIGANGVFNLNGNSQQIGALSATGGAIIDFGAGDTNNTFVFGSYTAPTSGVLTVNNWTQGQNILATTGTLGTSVSTIYLSGYGVAALGSTTSTLYGSATLIDAAAQNWAYWRGSGGTGWTTYGNWRTQTGTIAGTPNSTTALADIGMYTTTYNPDLGGNRTLNGLRFDSAATRGFNVTGSSRTLTMSSGTTTGIAFIQQQSDFDQQLSFTTLSLARNTMVDVTGAGNLTISAALAGTGNLVKDGTGGKLILSGSGTGWTGALFVNAGVVQLTNANAIGTAAGTVASGGSLELAGGITVANSLTVSGVGDSGNGVLHSVGGANTLSGVITAAADTTIAADTGTSLTLSNGISGTNVDLTIAGAGAVTVGAIATGSGAINVNSAGTVTMNGAANTNTGTTTVNSGTLVLAKTAGTAAINGNLLINGGAVQLNAGNQIANGSAITLNGSGTLNLNGQADTVNQISSTSATSTIALGTGGSLTISAVSGQMSAFKGILTGSSTSSLNIGGTSKVYLSGNGAGFAGAVNVNSGTLNLSGSNNVIGTGGVTIASGANLQLQGGITLANAFSINGSGTTANGAIESMAGANAITGVTTLTGASMISADGGSLTLGAVSLGANALTVQGANDTTINGIISGTGGSLVKNDTATLVLSGANTFTGNVTVNSGTLQINGEAALGGTTATKTIALGNATVHVTGGFAANSAKTWAIGANAAGTFDIDSAQTVTLPAAGDLTGSTTSQLIKAGGGTLALGNNNTGFTGSVLVNAGTLELDSASAAGSNTGITLNGATLSLKSTTNVATTFTNNITVSADSTIATDRYSGTNTNYTYTLGTLAIGSNTLMTTGGNGYDLQFGNVATSGATVFNTATAGSDLTLGTVTGTGSLTKSGAGTLVLGGTSANTFSGGLTVKDGTVRLTKTAGLDATGTGALTIGDGTGASASAIVQLGAANQINNTVAVTINSDGRLDLNGNAETLGSVAASSSSASITLGAGALTTGANNASTTFAGAISGTGSLVKTGSGTFTLTGANTYTGSTTVSGGTLALAVSNALSSSTNLIVSSGSTVSLGGGLSQTVAGLTTNASSTINLGSNAVLTVNRASASTLLGSLGGTGTLAYTGGGGLTLANDINFSGTLSFTGGGTLGLGATVAFDGTLLIGGGTLALSNYNLTVGTLHITGDTVLDFGNSTATTLNATNLIIDAGVKVSVINWVNLTDYFIAQNFPGAVLNQRGAAPENQITFTGYTNNQTSWVSWDHEITPAPEPATYGVLLMSAVLGCFGVSRWRAGRRR